MVDTVILVTGLTRAGKSTFINALLKEDRMNVNHTLALHSSTDIKCVVIPDRLPLGQGRLLIAEVPGFDEEHKGDAEKLKEVAEWLQSTLTKNTVFGGVIYLHAISETRFSTVAASELMALRASFGQSSQRLDRFVLVTTKWGRISQEEAEGKEKELTEKQWSVLVNRGSPIFRFEFNEAKKEIGYDSAWKAVESLLNCKAEAPNITDRLEEFKKLQSSGQKEERSYIASMIRLIFGYSYTLKRKVSMNIQKLRSA